MNKTGAFLAGGLLGAAAIVLGLAWDFALHARDPTLAHREGLFALTNPGHVLLGAGILLVVVGLIPAAYFSLPLHAWGRRTFLASSIAVIVVAGVVAAWAASVERSARDQATESRAHGAAVAPVLPVTSEQLKAAARLLEETTAAVAKYGDLRAAVAAGYQPMEPPDLDIVHYVNRDYFTDADVLRPEHVQSLIYYNTARGPVLIGAMYIMPTLAMSGPEIGGSLTNWHHHDNLCFDNTTNVVVAFANSPFFDRPGKSRSCPPGSSNRRTPEMLHVWLVDNPNGPFDSDMEPEDLAAILSGRPAN